VQSVVVDVAGCGCSASSGKIFAAKPGTSAEADGKFEATFNVIYKCKTSAGAISADDVHDGYADMEECAMSCGGPEKICTGMVNASSIVIINPGWGYTTAPTLFVKDVQYSSKTLVSGTSGLGCDVKFNATVLSGAGFDAEYNKTSGLVTVIDHGLNYTDLIPEPLVSIHCPGTPCASTQLNHPRYRAKVGGHLRHPFSALAAEVDAFRAQCLENGTADWSCHSHTNLTSITIVGWQGTTTDCATALTATMRPDKVTIPALSDYCSKDDGLRSTWPQGKPASWSVWGDASPLKVYQPMFILRRIMQSTSEPGKVNTLTVSLAPSVRLVEGSSITISGLVNAIHEKGKVNLTTHQGPAGLTGRWVCKGTLVITVGACTFWPGHIAVLSFKVLNNKPSGCVDMPGYVDGANNTCGDWSKHPARCSNPFDPPSNYNNAKWGIDPSVACCVCRGPFQAGLPVSIKATSGACNQTVSPDNELLYPFQEIHDPSIRPGVHMQQDYGTAPGDHDGTGCEIPTAGMFLGAQSSAEFERDFRGVTGEKHSMDYNTWPLTVPVPAFVKHRVWQTHAYPDPDCSENDPEPYYQPNKGTGPLACSGTCTCSSDGQGTCSQAGQTCTCEQSYRKRVGRAAATAGVNGRKDNTLNFQFAVNVNVSRSSYFRIRGLKGVYADTKEIQLISMSPANVTGNKFCKAVDGYTYSSVQASYTAPELCTGLKIDFAAWDNTEKTLSLFPLTDLAAGREFKFSIHVDTYEEDTEKLAIEIALSSVDQCGAIDTQARLQSLDYRGVDIPFAKMHIGMEDPRTAAACPLHIFNQQTLETVPFVARKPMLYTARMRQQHPFAMPMASIGDGMRFSDQPDVGKRVANATERAELDRQRRNWIYTTLVSNVPMNSNTRITLRNLKGMNFTEVPVENTASNEFAISMPPGTVELQLLPKPNGDVATQGQKVWPGQRYSFSLENRNHFPQEMMGNAVVTKTQEQACVGEMDPIQCTNIGAVNSRVGCCRWDNGCKPGTGPSDLCNGVLAYPRPLHTIGAETRRASDITIESTGCIAMPQRPMTFDKPPDARYCKGYTAHDSKYQQGPAAQLGCIDMHGCITLEDFNPFRVLQPTFCVRKIEQTSNLPGKENEITVELRALFDIPSRQNITVAGLPPHTCDSKKIYGWPSMMPRVRQFHVNPTAIRESSGAIDCFGAECNQWSSSSCNPLHRHVVITTGMQPVPNVTSTLIKTTDHEFFYETPVGQKLVFKWKLTNWNSSALAVSQATERANIMPYGPASFGVSSLPWVAAPVELITPPIAVESSTPGFPSCDAIGLANTEATGICDMTAANLDRRPFSVQVPRVCGCTSELTSSRPGNIARIKITFRTNVDFPNGLDILNSTDLLLTGLIKQSSTAQFTLAPGQAGTYEPPVFGDLEFRQWNTTHLNTILRPEEQRLILRPRNESHGLRVAHPEAPATVAFEIEVKNPVPLALSTGFESAPFVLHIPSMPNLAQTQVQCGTVMVEKPQWTFAKAGQVTPYPCSENAISVTLKTNYVPNTDMFILIEGLPSSVFTQQTESAVEVRNLSSHRTGQGLQDFWTHPTLTGSSATRKGLLVKNGNEAALWFKIIYSAVSADSNMQPGQDQVFSFQVKNPGSQFPTLPTMRVSAYGPQVFQKNDKTKMTALLEERRFEYDQSTAAMCKTQGCKCEVYQPQDFDCVVYQPQDGDARPLYIREPKIINSFVGQSHPYTTFKNTITISLQLNVHLYAPSRIQLFNFKGLRAGVEKLVDMSASDDLDSRGFCPDVLDTQPKAEQNVENMLSVIFEMKNGVNLTAGSSLTMRMGITNPNPDFLLSTAKYEDPADVRATLPGEGGSCSTQCCVKMSTSQSLSPPSTLEQLLSLFPAAATAPDYSGANYSVAKRVQESFPLYLRRPRFRSKQIWQESPHPSAENTIYLQLSTNVPLDTDTLIELTGFKSSNPDIIPTGLSAVTASAELQCGAGQVSTCIQHFKPYKAECVPISDSILVGCREMKVTLTVKKKTIANFDYMLAFRVKNPKMAQAAPIIKIEAKRSGGQSFMVDIMESPKVTCKACGLADDSKALFIRGSTDLISSIAAYVWQTNPFSRGTNYIILSLVANGPLKGGTKLTIAGFREWDQGAIGLKEVEQSRGFAEDFGIKTTKHACMGPRCTDLTTHMLSNDDGIVYANLKMAGVGCTVSAVLTDPGPLSACASPGSCGSGLKIEVKVGCGQVTKINILDPGSGYTNPNGIGGRPFDVNATEYLEKSPWSTQVKCTTQPEIEWFRSHEVLDRTPTKLLYDDTSNELRFEIGSLREAAGCVNLTFKIPVFNPITATDTNPPPSYPLNLNLTIRGEYQYSENQIIQLYPPVPVLARPDVVSDPRLPLGVCEGYNRSLSRTPNTDCDLKSIPFMTGGSVPMRIYAPTFLKAQVQQSMPYPGAFNEIFVTLMTNFDLSDTEDILLTFVLGTAEPPDAPSAGGTMKDLDSRASADKPKISNVALSSQDNLTTSQTPSQPNGYVNISGYIPPNVIETALIQSATMSKVHYSYGDYIAVCSLEDCSTSKEVFKVLAYSSTTERLRLRRRTQQSMLTCPESGCFVYKVVYLEDTNLTQETQDDKLQTASTIFGNSAQWISSRITGNHTLKLSIGTGKTFKGGHEYRFKFTVRNPVPVEPFDGSRYKGATDVTVRVETRVDGLDKIRIEHALGSRANHKATMSQSPTAKRTRTADGQDFSDVYLNKALKTTDDIVHVRGTKVTRKVAPGVQVQIGSEIMTVVHAMQHVEILSTVTTTRLLVKRAQQGTQAVAHDKCPPSPSVDCLSQVFFLLPGIQAGDGIPFKVSRKAVVLSYMRQTTALPGASNRLVTTLAFNYPLNAQDLVSITGLKGYSLRSTKLGDPCATTPIPTWDSSPMTPLTQTEIGGSAGGGDDEFRAYALLCPTRREAVDPYVDNDRFFKYLPTVNTYLTTSDSSAVNGKTLGLDLGSYGKMHQVPGLRTTSGASTDASNSSNFTKEAIQLPDTASSCFASSLDQVFDRFDYDQNRLWSALELKDYQEAYADDGKKPGGSDISILSNAQPSNLEWFAAYMFEKYTGLTAVDGATMTPQQYYAFTKHIGVLHSMHAVDADPSDTDQGVTWDDFKSRFGTVNSACPAFRTGDFIVVEPSDNNKPHGDEEVLLITEIPLANAVRPRSSSYNVYRGQLFDAKVPDHQVLYSMYALYEHGGDGGVFSGELHARHSGINLIPPGQLLPFTIDVLNPGSSSSPWKSSDQAVESPQWQIIGKNLQLDGGKLTLRNMTLSGSFSVEQGQSTLFQPDRVGNCTSSQPTACYPASPDISNPFNDKMVRLQPPGEPNLLDAGDLRPTKTYRTGLLGNRIMGSNYCPGAKNTITVTVVPSVPIPAFAIDQTAIVFSNFRGAVVDASILNLRGAAIDSGHFKPSGQWNTESGANQTLTVHVRSALRAGRPYIFEFTVRNPVFNQSGTNISLHTISKITEVILPFGATQACGCEAGVYVHEAEGGYGGSGFKAEVIISGGQVASFVTNSGEGYSSVPPLKMTQFKSVGSTTYTDCSNSFTCGRCLDSACGLGATQRMLLANIDGVQSVSEVNIKCDKPQINAVLTLNSTEGGFGSGFEGLFNTSANNMSTSITVKHPGTGYMYIPYSVADQIVGDGCECTQNGSAYHTDCGTKTNPLTEDQFRQWMNVFYPDGKFMGTMDSDGPTCDWLFNKIDANHDKALVSTEFDNFPLSSQLSSFAEFNKDGSSNISYSEWKLFCNSSHPWSSCVRKSTLCRCQGPKLILPDGCFHDPLPPTPATTPLFKMAGGRLFGATIARHDERLDKLPLFVQAPHMVEYHIGQESPWPGATNIITVTLKACMSFKEGSRISLTGFNNVVKADISAEDRKIVDGCTCTSTTLCPNCPFRNSATQEPVFEFCHANSLHSCSNSVTGTRNTIVFTVKQDWESGERQILSFRITNPPVIAPDYHPPPPLYISASLPTTPAGRKHISDTLMIVNATEVHGGIKGGRVPLAIWSDTWPTCFKDPVSTGISQNTWRNLPQTYPREPRNRYDFEKTFWLPQDYPVPFHSVAIACPNHTADDAFDSRECPANGIVPAMGVKYVSQSSCARLAKNTITVTFASNVPLAKTCQHPCLPNAKITIRGLKGLSKDWAMGELGTQAEYDVGGVLEWAADLLPSHLPRRVKIEDVNGSGAAGVNGLFGPHADFIMDSGEGQVIFSIESCQYMVPGRNYSLKFNIMNGPSVQESPPDIYIDVNADGIDAGYNRGPSIGHPDPWPNLMAVATNAGRHLGAACYDAGGCHNVRLAKSVYIDKPKGVPDGGHQPLLIVFPGEFSSFTLYFGSCRSNTCSIPDKPAEIARKSPSDSANAASSQQGERDAEIILEFKLGDWNSNELKLSIHNNTKGNYTKLRSKRYFWMRFPITIEPTGDTVKFQVEGVDTGSRMRNYAYTGVAVCSDGMRSDTDPPEGAPNSGYKCSTGFNMPGRTQYTSVVDKPPFWKLLLVMDPEVSYKDDGTGSSILEDGKKVFDEKTYGGIASAASGTVRIRMTGLRYSRHGVSVVNSKEQFAYFSLAADCRDGTVKKTFSSSKADDWWINGSSFAFVKPQGVGSVYPTSVDYWQNQKTQAGETRKVMHVLDYSGNFGEKDAKKPWKDSRTHSDVELKFGVNNIFKKDESVRFTLGDDTQKITCQEGASKTADGWTVVWRGNQATVTRQGPDIVPVGSGVLQSCAGLFNCVVVVTMAAAHFKCSLPENGLNPDSTWCQSSAIKCEQGLAEALSLGTFKASFIPINKEDDGRATTGIVDERHPVYKYQCLGQTIATRDADYCSGVYPVRMCAVRDSAVTAYVAEQNYGNAKGFQLLIDGYPKLDDRTQMSVYGKNITGTLPAATSLTQQMMTRCSAVHTLACKFDNAPQALAANFISVTDTDYMSPEAIQSICCAHSPETHWQDEAGIGNLATCIQNSDCDDISAGVDSFSTSMPLVALDLGVCCDYCYEFYGSVACITAQGLAPGIVDGTGTSSDNPGKQQPYVEAYCQNTINCTTFTPCKGYTLGGKGTTIPKTLLGPISVTTLAGDGVRLC
jgi:hypothetical protein